MQELLAAVERSIPPEGAECRFTLTRYDRERTFRGSLGDAHQLCELDGGEAHNGSSLLHLVDAFVEGIERDCRPTPVPDGFETWRFARESLTTTGGADLTRALCALLDDVFNSPGLYDGRDLRAR